jgi:ribosomal protein S27E
MEKVKKSIQGECPKCKSEQLNYGVMELCDTGIFFDVNCAKCNWEGQEWYSLAFDSYYQKED